MNSKKIQKFVLRYLEANECGIIEKSPHHVTVKLSPKADKDLTNRSYYWSFVERTGAEPETMTFTFIFDKEKYEEQSTVEQNGRASSGNSIGVNVANTHNAPPQQSETILGRYFGVSGAPSFTGRIPQDELVFGSRRLEQIFTSVKNTGRFVRLFESPRPDQRSISQPRAYSTWLCINYTVEFACDMKRSELHSLGIHLSSGQIVEHFHERLLKIKFTPNLPIHVHLQRDLITTSRAAGLLEKYLVNKLKQLDHRWAREAEGRLAEESELSRNYYETLLQSIEADKKEEVQMEFDNRMQEIEWQYSPRIAAAVINCGLFHVDGEASPITDETR